GCHRKVAYVNRPALQHGASTGTSTAERDLMADGPGVPERTELRSQAELAPVDQVDQRVPGITEPGGCPGYGHKDGLQPEQQTSRSARRLRNGRLRLPAELRAARGAEPGSGGARFTASETRHSVSPVVRRSGGHSAVPRRIEVDPADSSTLSVTRLTQRPGRGRPGAGIGLSDQAVPALPPAPPPH